MLNTDKDLDAKISPWRLSVAPMLDWGDALESCYENKRI